LLWEAAVLAVQVLAVEAVEAVSDTKTTTLCLLGVVTVLLLEQVVLQAQGQLEGAAMPGVLIL